MRGEEELNHSNSTIAEMLHPVPDYLHYTSAITLSMPTNAEKVRVMRSDSVFLGFRYDIPFDFIMDGELSDDKISISDVRRTAISRRRNLSSRVTTACLLSSQ